MTQNRYEEDKRKRLLIKEFEKLPACIVATAYVYADSLNRFGVDVTKEWKTAVEQRAALDQAYMQGRQYEREQIQGGW